MRLFLLLVTAVVLPSFLAVAEPEPESRRTCRIVFPERPNDAPKAAFLFDGKTSQRVALPSMNFSEVVPLASGELTLLMTAEEVKDPENLPPGAPRLRIAEGIRDFYILIIPDRSNPTLPLEMRLVDAGSKLKPGETLWFNLTDHLIAAQLGGSKMTVAPRGVTVSKDPLPSSGYYMAEFAYQPKAEGAIQRITEQHWWHDAGSKHVGFMVNTGGKLPRIYFYRDFRNPEDVEPEE